MAKSFARAEKYNVYLNSRACSTCMRSRPTSSGGKSPQVAPPGFPRGTLDFVKSPQLCLSHPIPSQTPWHASICKLIVCFTCFCTQAVCPGDCLVAFRVHLALTRHHGGVPWCLLLFLKSCDVVVAVFVVVDKSFPSGTLSKQQVHMTRLLCFPTNDMHVMYE